MPIPPALGEGRGSRAKEREEERSAEPDAGMRVLYDEHLLHVVLVLLKYFQTAPPLTGLCTSESPGRGGGSQPACPEGQAKEMET